jgi:hypothetical protein
MVRQAGGGPRAKLTHFADNCVPPMPGKREAAMLKQARCCCWAERLLTVHYTTEGIMVEAHLQHMIVAPTGCWIELQALLCWRLARGEWRALRRTATAHRRQDDLRGRAGSDINRLSPGQASRPRPWAAARVTSCASSAQCPCALWL